MDKNSLCSVFKSIRGRDKLNFEGFSFDFIRVKSQNIYNWSCELKKNKNYKCKVKLNTKKIDENHFVVALNGVHNHEPNALRKPIADVLAKIKQNAKRSAHESSEIIQDAVASCSREVGVCLPSKSSLQQQIKRERKKPLAGRADQN